MIGRTIIACAALLIAASFLGETHRENQLRDDAKPVSISIAVPRTSEERRIDIHQPNSHFHVVVTNTSDCELRFWETWNSWGYFNLHFDVLNEKGEVAYSIVKNNNVGWTVNSPTSVLLKPGEHFVLDVDLDRDTWVMPFLKTPTSQGVFNLKLRAVFEITPDAESKVYGIWTGKVESASDDYVIRYWR